MFLWVKLSSLRSGVYSRLFVYESAFTNSFSILAEPSEWGDFHLLEDDLFFLLFRFYKGVIAIFS
jgi:hypothetical protein